MSLMGLLEKFVVPAVDHQWTLWARARLADAALATDHRWVQGKRILHENA